MKTTQANYFKTQLDKAVKNRMPEKADYFRRRITEVAQNGTGQLPINIIPSKQTAPEMLQSAIKVWNVRSHSASTRHAFLVGKGVPEVIIFQALAFIGNGQLVQNL